MIQQEMVWLGRLAYTEGVTTFSMGEEVMYGGERYVVWGFGSSEPRRVRLLATGQDGAKIVWAAPEKLERLQRYVVPQNDTAKY